MIRIDDIVCSYKKKVLLNHVSVELQTGQIHGMVGHNGSGKTMLLKCVSGYLKPDSGSICIDGKYLYKDIAFPPSMGIILESPGFLPYATGMQNLQWLCSIKRRARKRDIEQALETVGLLKERYKLVGQYSLGMKQRLGLAQAIMESPELLILDEPFNALDASGVEHMRNVLIQLREQGTTILLTSHYQEDIDMLCDTVHLMEAGTLCTV